MIRARRQLILTAVAGCLAIGLNFVQPAAAQPPRVKFPESRIDVASSQGTSVRTPPPALSPLTASPIPSTFDPYSVPPPPSPLARFLGVAPAQAVGPIGPPPAVMSAPAGAAPYYAFQPAVAAPGVQYAVPGMVPGATHGFRPGPYAELGAVFLDREDRVRDRAILIDNTPLPNGDNNLFRTSDGDFNYELGPRILVGYDFDQRVAWEALYFGIYSWDWSADFMDLGDISVVDDLGLGVPLFFGADMATVQLDSDFHNLEINRIGCFNSCVSWLIGFRYVRLTEDFNLTTADIAAPGVNSVYDVETANNLYGGQLGLRLRETAGDFSLDLLGKAGVYGNSASQKTFVASDIGPAVFRDTETTGTDVAFVGDLTLTGRYHISDTVALQGGYMAMWMEGVALAMDQLDFTFPGGGETIDKDGGVFIHGAHAGLLVIW